MKSASYVFGYGSLVNRQTHNYSSTIAGTVSGWQRVWMHTETRTVAFLSVAPVTGGQIDGLFAEVPSDDWPALDQREAAYDRVAVTDFAIADKSAVVRDPQMYRAQSQFRSGSDARRPILLSYLDCVVQGYFQVFGQSGAARFFATTDGWDCPILDDRSAPRYSRNVELLPAERAIVDQSIATLPCCLTALDDHR